MHGEAFTHLISRGDSTHRRAAASGFPLLYPPHPAGLSAPKPWCSAWPDTPFPPPVRRRMTSSFSVTLQTFGDEQRPACGADAAATRKRTSNPRAHVGTGLGNTYQCEACWRREQGSQQIRLTGVGRRHRIHLRVASRVSFKPLRTTATSFTHRKQLGAHTWLASSRMYARPMTPPVRNASPYAKPSAAVVAAPPERTNTPQPSRVYGTTAWCERAVRQPPSPPSSDACTRRMPPVLCPGARV